MTLPSTPITTITAKRRTLCIIGSEFNTDPEYRIWFDAGDTLDVLFSSPIVEPDFQHVIIKSPSGRHGILYCIVHEDWERH